MVTSLTAWSTWPWLWRSVGSLTVSSLSSSRHFRLRYIRLASHSRPTVFCLTEIFPPQLLLQNLDGAQSRVRQHASSSMMSSMMRGRPAQGGLEVEDVE